MPAARIRDTDDDGPMSGWIGRAVALGAVAIVAGSCIPSTAQRQQTPGTGPSAGTSVVQESPAASASGPSTRPSFVRPTPTPLPTFLVYMVRPGDTLTSIARAHGTTARSIAFWNRSRYPSLDPDSSTYSPNRIEVGWELVLIPDVELDPEELPEPSPSIPPPSASPSG
jgi:hypothetical protein